MKLAALAVCCVSLVAKSAPTVVSGVPAAADGASVVFTFTGADQDGAGDIYRVYWLIAPTAQIAGCHGFYDRGSDRFYLYDDALAVPIGPLIPGTAGAIANSQCSINGQGAGAVAQGQTLAVTVKIGITLAYGANGQNVYVWVKDRAGKETGWVQTGTWLPLPQPLPPTSESRTQLDEYFQLTTSLNQWVTLTHLPSRGTLIDVWFIGKSGNEDRWMIRPRLDFDDPKRVELVTGEPGEVMLVYWTDEK